MHSGFNTFRIESGDLLEVVVFPEKTSTTSAISSHVVMDEKLYMCFTSHHQFITVGLKSYYTDILPFPFTNSRVYYFTVSDIFSSRYGSRISAEIDVNPSGIILHEPSHPRPFDGRNPFRPLYSAHITSHDPHN